MWHILVSIATALAWCLIHSLLIDAWRGRRWGRLLYNDIAVITFVALMVYVRSLPAEAIWSWHGPWQLLRLALAAAGLALGAWGRPRPRRRAFLGLRRSSADPPVLSRAGVLGRVRHPWYAAGILLLPIWPTAFTSVNVAWRTVSWYTCGWEPASRTAASNGSSARSSDDTGAKCRIIPRFGFRRRD